MRPGGNDHGGFDRSDAGFLEQGGALARGDQRGELVAIVSEFVVAFDDALGKTDGFSTGGGRR